MARDVEKTVSDLRDTVLRLRRGLPLPDGVSVEELLESAADIIETLKNRLNYREY